jgi:DNA-binding Xre family transcriptional regulator
MEDLKVILSYISQMELAKRIGITKSNPAYWLKINEVPEIHLETLKKIRKEVTQELKYKLKQFEGKKK